MMTPSQWFTIDPDYLNRLHRQAVHWLHHGVNVLPFWGDMNPAAPKAPALREYRDRLYTQRTTDADIDKWFGVTGDGCQALGIITGSISKLAVLEFDSPELAARFANELPALTDTYSELSAGRGLPHYFYHLPNGASYRSMGRAGVVEWLADGRRCIVAPTQIDGRTYQRQPGNIRTLTLDEFEQIGAWLDTYAPAAQPLEITAAAGVTVGAVGWLTDVMAELIGQGEGRNNALFSTALLANNLGIEKEDAAAELLPAFMAIDAPNGHRAQNARQRRSEGQRTISSAYRYPAKGRIPNAVRECLLQNKQANTARAADLLALRWPPGSRVTQAAARKLLQANGMGNKTALTVVPEIAKIGQHEQEKANNGSGTGSKHPDAERGDATACPLTPASDYRSVSEFTGGIQGGTAPKYVHVPGDLDTYRKGRGQINPNARLDIGETMVIPSAETYCRVLGVVDKGSDVLPITAMKSNSDYRAALTLKLLVRTQQATTARQTAKRLSVTKQTARKTLRRLGAVETPQDEKREPIAPGDITRFADIDSLLARGCYLEIDGRGARVDMATIRGAWSSGQEVMLVTRMPTKFTAPLQTRLGIVSKPSEAAQNRASKPTVQRNRAAGTDYQQPAETLLYGVVNLNNANLLQADIDLLQDALSLGAEITAYQVPELVELPADDEIRRAG